MYKLVIQDDEGKTTVVPLIRDELTIGRKEGNTIRLTERNVSRQHARLTRANGTIVIEDLNSYNGIRVNGSRIQGRATINESDRVQIGDYLIEVRSDAVAEKSTGQDETQPLERVEGTSPPATVPSMPVPTAEGTSPGTAAAVAPKPAALADTDPGRAAGVSNHGRLVILSTNFAGQEFVLDKSKLVIGRTDDNDIWLNHRSISRHHARVVLESGRYSIEDMQSSNGVRVNGEEYGKVELRRADVIDLGHVRLRFVEPGEDFVFGRDAQAVDVTPYSGGRTWLWITLAILALVGMAVVFFVMNSGDDKGGNGEGTGTGTSMAGTGDGPGTNNNIQPDLPDAAPSEIEVDAAVDQDAENKANALKNLEQAKKLLASNQLSEARVAIDTAKSLDPDNPDILAVSKEIESRLDQSDVADANWARFMTAVNNAQRPSEAKRVRSMADDFGGTKYASQVDAQVRKAKSNYRRSLLQKARRAKDCDDRDRIASSAVWPDLRDDVRRIKCRSTPGPGTGTGTGTGPGTGSSGNAQKDYQAAIQAAASGSGGLTQAYAACGKVRGSTWVKKCLVLACRNQNKSKAQSYLNRLGKSSRDQFVNLCMAQGVSLTP